MLVTIRAIDGNGYVPVVAAHMSEDELMENIRDACTRLHLRAFHCYDSRRSWGPGFPNLVIGGRGGVLFRECKDQSKGLSGEQIRWRDILRASGANWALWRPADWLSGRIWAQLEQVTAH